MKKAILTAAVFLAAAAVFSQNIYVAKSQERTSEDLPLTYRADRTDISRTGVQLQGVVRNTGSTPYRWVKVTFTASSSSGAFIARDYTYTEPKEIGPGEVAYIDKWLDTRGERPGKIEWNVTGKE